MARRSRGKLPVGTPAATVAVPRAALWFGLVAIALVAYLPLLSAHTQLLWDDDGHVTKPALRSLEGLWRIWFDVGATQQYYPVLHSAFWIQARLWGDQLAGYHIVNVVLHGTSAFLVALILRRLRIPGALLAAAIFALHPVHVESVAWITELKNALSGVFYLAAAYVYLRFDETRAPRHYAVALGLFVMAVLSKSVTATLPAGLLVVLWWRKSELDWRRDGLPLLPLVAAGVVAGATTVWVERTLIGAEGEDFQLGFIERTLIAGRAVWFYLASLLWPAGLTFNYPRWAISQSVWWQYLFPVGVAAALVGCWWLRARGALAALLFFCLTLAPALGFVNVYPFRFSFVADHFQYLASLGIIAGLTAAYWSFATRHAGVRAAGAVGAAICVALGLVTQGLSRQYVDNETLYRSTISRNPSSWLAYNNLATLLVTGSANQAVDGVRLAEEALRLKPDYVEARYNLGVGLEAIGQFDRAADAYRTVLAALANDPKAPRRIASVERRLGAALMGANRLDDAIAALERSIRLDPSVADAQSDLGIALSRSGRPDLAILRFREAVRLAPGLPSHLSNLGGALLQAGQEREAASTLAAAVAIDPNLADAQHNLGAAFAALGQYADAAAAFREAVRLRPGDPSSRAALDAALARIKAPDAPAPK